MSDAARKAARGLNRDFGELTELQVSKKGAADFVSAADIRAEQVLFEALTKARPGYGFLGEEPRLIASGTENTKIETFETFGSRFLDGPCLLSIRLLLTRRTGRCEQAKFRHRKVSLVEETNDFLTDCTSRAEYAYVICHLIF